MRVLKERSTKLSIAWFAFSKGDKPMPNKGGQTNKANELIKQAKGRDCLMRVARQPQQLSPCRNAGIFLPRLSVFQKKLEI